MISEFQARLVTEVVRKYQGDEERAAVRMALTKMFAEAPVYGKWVLQLMAWRDDPPPIEDILAAGLFGGGGE